MATAWRMPTATGGDEFEVAGCTDATACNYDADATDDDGSCAELDECVGVTEQEFRTEHAIVTAMPWTSAAYAAVTASPTAPGLRR